MGIPEAICHSIAVCPLEAQPHRYANILLTGGCSLFPGFRERIEAEVRSWAPDDFDVQVTLPAKWASEPLHVLHEYLVNCLYNRLQYKLRYNAYTKLFEKGHSILLFSYSHWAGHVVAKLVETLCYKLEGHRLYSQWEYGFFSWLNSSNHIVALGSTQPLTEMSTRNPGGKRCHLYADCLTSHTTQLGLHSLLYRCHLAVIWGGIVIAICEY
jgi:hypothetical protein